MNTNAEKAGNPVEDPWGVRELLGELMTEANEIITKYKKGEKNDD